MSGGSEPAGTGVWPRRVVTAVLALLVLSTSYLLASPVDHEDVLAATGQSWEEVVRTQPGLATHLEREGRIVAVGYLGLAVFALALCRRWAAGDAGARRTLWLLPGLLAATAAVMASGGATSLAGVYATLAGLTTVALCAATGSAASKVRPEARRRSPRRPRRT